MVASSLRLNQRMVISIHLSALRFERPGFVMDDLTIWLVFESLRVRCCCPLLDFLFLSLFSVFSPLSAFPCSSGRHRWDDSSTEIADGVLAISGLRTPFYLCVCVFISDFIASLSSMLFLSVLFMFSRVVPRYRLSCSGTYGSSHFCLILFNVFFSVLLFIRLSPSLYVHARVRIATCLFGFAMYHSVSVWLGARCIVRLPFAYILVGVFGFNSS